MATLGKNIIILLDNVAIAGARSCTITHDCELLPKSQPMDDEYMHYDIGRKSWRVATGQLFISNVAEGYVRVGTAVSLSITDADTNETITADAVCQEFRVDASRGNLAQGSFIFLGNGDLL